MQPDVEFPATNTIEAVQPSNGIVPLEDAHSFAKVGQPNAGCEARHPGANDGDVIMRSGIQAGIRSCERERVAMFEQPPPVGCALAAQRSPLPPELRDERATYTEQNQNADPDQDSKL